MKIKTSYPEWRTILKSCRNISGKIDMARDKKGFTLMELMLVVLLLSIVMVTMSASFFAQQSAYKANKAISEVQQTVGSIGDIISRDIANSGAGINMITTCASGTLTPGLGLKKLDTALTCVDDYTTGIFVVANGTAPNIQDVLYTIGIDETMFFYLSQSTDGESATYQFTYRCFTDSDLFAVDDWIAVSDIDHGGIFKVTGVSPSSCGTSNFGTEATITATDQLLNQSYKYGTVYHRFVYNAGSAFITKLNFSKYYMDNSTDPKKLMEKYAPGGASANISVLTNSIDKMAVVLGYNNPNTGVPATGTINSYKNITAAVNMCAQPLDDPTNVRSVRLLLLGKTQEMEAGKYNESSAVTDSSSGGDINFGRYGDLDSATPQGYRYRALSRQVNLVNSIGTRFNQTRQYLTEMCTATY